MATEEETTSVKKRKRGPYLSYLSNPIGDAVPRSTLRSWSCTVHEENCGKREEQSFNFECNVVDVDNPGPEIIENSNEDTSVEDEQVDLLSSIFENAEEWEATDTYEMAEAATVNGTLDDFEIATEPGQSSYLFDHVDDEFIDDCDEEDCNWEEVWEGDEETCHVQEDDDKPLYNGARITLSMSMLLIITFAMRHQLSGTALTDLLALINLHIIAPNCFTRSMATLHKFFKNLKNPVELHHYCSFCYEYFGTDKPPCCTNKHCLKDLTKKNALPYFLVIPLKPQLEALFARPEVKEILAYRQSRKNKNSKNIEDILDGKLYKAHFDDDGYFKGTNQHKRESEIHISLQINTDGVALFKSSTFSVWPVYYIINELPPNCRFHRKNRLFGGLWFGTKKPHFQTFMQPFALSLKDLFCEGAPVNIDGDDKTVRCLLLCGSFDAPAKCLFQSFVQFNGNYGCPYCLHPGKTTKTSERGHTHAYPFNKENLVTGHYEERTHNQTKEFAKLATESIINTGVEKPEKGVKGLSWFLCVPGFDIIRGVAIDYMHGTLLGVVKMLINLWLDKQHHGESWYIGKYLKELEKRYVSIKPPSCISRLPRSIIGNFGHLKASELRSFLLFYSLPCLYGLLPNDYFQHYLLLVEAIFILLNHSISQDDLKKASHLLKHFCLRIEELYASRYETYNVHCLLHLVERVKDIGPLWTNSCFCFEDFNGELRHLFHGTQNVEMQIVLSICIQQKIPELIPLLHPYSAAMEFFETLTSKQRMSHKKEIVCDNIFAIGTIAKHTINVQHRQLLEREIGEVESVLKFKRVCIGNKVIHSKEYKSGIRRNNFTVQYQAALSDLNYGEILYFVKCFVKCPNPVFCSEICTCKVASYHAVVNQFEKDNDTVLSTDTITGASVPHIVPVLPCMNEMVVIPLHMILQICVYIECGSGDKAFVAIFPNMFEKD